MSYVEPFGRRVRGVLAGATVIDSERVLLVHRPGASPYYAFPPVDVAGVRVEPDPLVPSFVKVRWDDVEEWYEEDQQVFGHPRNPYHRVDCIPTHRRLTVSIGDIVVVDSTDTIGVYETALAPRLYVERRHLRMELQRSATSTYCPYKGIATHWTAVVDGVEVPDVAWSYEAPYPACDIIGGLLSFYEDKATVDTDLPAASNIDVAVRQA